METTWLLIYTVIVILAWMMDLFATRLGFFRAWPLESWFLVFFGEGMLLWELSRQPTPRVALFALIGGVAGASFLYEGLIYARLRLPRFAVRPNTELPPFELEGPGSDRPLTSAELAGAPYLLVYHRGPGCSFSVAQLNVLEKEVPRLAELGVKKVLAVNGPSVGDMDRLAERYGQDLQVVYDPDGGLGEALGLKVKGRPGGMAPAAILCDAEGTVKWCQRAKSYRSPPHPTWIRMKVERGVLD